MKTCRNQRIPALILLLCLLPLFALAERPTLSVAELRAQTPARWTQTYQAHGRTIAVDVPIEIPDVPRIPIFHATKGKAVFPKEVRAEYGTNHGDRPGVFDGFLGKQLLRPVRSGEIYLQSDDYSDGQFPAVPAEDNPNSFEHALRVVSDRITALTGFVYGQDFFLIHARVRGRRYLRGKPTTDMGTYSMGFRQHFGGMTLSKSSCAYEDLAATYYDDENLQICIVYAFDGYEQVLDDVPLAPFSEVQKTLEAEIQAGRLRSVEGVRLCYRSVLESKKDGHHYKLVPVWEIAGQWAKDAKYEPSVIELENGETTLNWDLSPLWDVSAQDGTLYQSTVYDVQKPVIYTWEDVR